MQMYTLSGIVRKEPFVLFDTSTDHADHEFTEEIFPLRSFNQLHHRRLSDILSDAATLLEFVSHKNAYTIEEVVQELSSLREHYSKKLSAFNRNKRDWLRLRYGSRNGADSEADSECEEEILFNELCWNIKEAVRISRRYKPRNNFYECFTDCLSLLVKEIGIEDSSKEMNRYDPRYEYRINRKGKCNLGTDEKLTAASFYRSIFEHSDAAIVTRDARFVRLLIYFTKLLSSNDVYHGKVFRDGLKSHPVRLYLPFYEENLGNDGGNFKRNYFKLVISTSDVRTPFYYKIPRHSESEDKLFKERINMQILSSESLARKDL